MSNNEKRQWIKKELGEIFEFGKFIDKDFFLSKLCVKFDCTTRTARDDLRVVMMINPELKDIFDKAKGKQRKLTKWDIKL